MISQENNKCKREVYLACKNKWNWSWLEEKDVNGDFISDYIRKIDASGLAFCIYCNKPVSYKSSGKKDILAHAKKSTHHLHNKSDYRQTTCLPPCWNQPSSSFELSKCSPKSNECNLTYGIAENVHTSSKCSALQNKSNPAVSLTDCKHHLEAYVVSFFSIIVCSKTN